MDLPSIIHESSSRSEKVLIALLVLVLASALYNIWNALTTIWWRPRRIKKAFESQGIPCVAPSHIFYGNYPEVATWKKHARSLPMTSISHDIAPRILPHYYQWRKAYGEKCVWWLGSTAQFVLPSPHYAKDIMSKKFGQYPRPAERPDSVNLTTNGIGTLEGEQWALRRRVMNPFFLFDKLKAMIPAMASCTSGMIDKWDIAQEINVHTEFQNLTADIIAHTAFGISFAEYKQVFELQHQQQALAGKINNSIYIPGARFLPSALNLYRWKLIKDIDTTVRQLIDERSKSIEVGHAESWSNDLLGLMIAADKRAAQAGSPTTATIGIGGMIGECKTFFFAGHETSSNMLTWTVLLLATNPEWQERARAEVQAVCGVTETPTFDTVNRLKMMNMVLNESLRLYPPALFLMREASQDMQLEDIIIPKGTQLTLPIIAWHHEEKYWGSDVHEFRPDRFSGGIAKASKVAGAYMPFSMGPRICMGQSFAILEGKIALAMILQRFRFRMSPAYRHAPTQVITLQPEFGMPIFFEKLDPMQQCHSM